MSIKAIYTLRETFTIIGLTGRTGSGCTRFAEIISKPPKFENNPMLRTPGEIKYNKNLANNNVVFKRKYTICYNYYKTNHKEYQTISYLSVLLLYSMHYGVHKKGKTSTNDFIDYIYDLVKENFKKSNEKFDEDYKDTAITKHEIENLNCYNPTTKKHDGNKIDYAKIIQDINSKLNFDINQTQATNLYDLFFDENSELKRFTDSIFQLFSKRDYYLGSFFVHRLGNKIRATGNPEADGNTLKENASTGNIYSIVSLLNRLIKAWKSKSQTKETHICIDSLRNSLEIMFLKERYAAFYMIAIHNEERCKERIQERIASRTINNENSIDSIVSKVIHLDEIESKVDDYKDGYFFAPDVENCIQRSDIHISNPGKEISLSNNELRQKNFYTMIEQWIKIQSLIMHPGIITPTHDERCMQIAFMSKFNSGCISRQVGAVITNKNNSICSVGWNDVPKGSVPCNLKDLNDIVNPDLIEKEDQSYSPFEINKEFKSYKDGGNFSRNTKIKFPPLIEQTKKIGLNHSYCFKNLHNKYENKDNQVHTRSLHAEENAMLQVSKYGGQGLIHGTLYTTASPCELCAKKAYQLGLKIVYIDPYPGISMQHILKNGYKQPILRMFTGIVGRAYNKLYEPLLSYKDELSILNPKNEDSNEKLKSNINQIMIDLFGKKPKQEINIIEFRKAVEYLLND